MQETFKLSFFFSIVPFFIIVLFLFFILFFLMFLFRYCFIFLLFFSSSHRGAFIALKRTDLLSPSNCSGDIQTPRRAIHPILQLLLRLGFSALLRGSVMRTIEASPGAPVMAHSLPMEPLYTTAPPLDPLRETNTSATIRN